VKEERAIDCKYCLMCGIKKGGMDSARRSAKRAKSIDHVQPFTHTAYVRMIKQYLGWYKRPVKEEKYEVDL
jgi:hypothetical protein